MGKPGICPLPPGGQRARQLALGTLGAFDLAKGTELVRGLPGLLRSHGPGRKGQQSGELFRLRGSLVASFRGEEKGPCPPWWELLPRTASPPGEHWKPPKPTSDGRGFVLSSFYPLDYNHQLFTTSPQAIPAPLRVFKRQKSFKSCSSNRRRGPLEEMQGWKEEGRGDPHPRCVARGWGERRGTLGPGSFHWPPPSPPTGPSGEAPGGRDAPPVTGAES